MQRIGRDVWVAGADDMDAAKHLRFGSKNRVDSPVHIRKLVLYMRVPLRQRLGQMLPLDPPPGHNVATSFRNALSTQSESVESLKGIGNVWPANETGTKLNGLHD